MIVPLVEAPICIYWSTLWLSRFAGRDLLTDPLLVIMTSLVLDLAVVLIGQSDKSRITAPENQAGIRPFWCISDW
jgi:hypothetical protein